MLFTIIIFLIVVGIPAFFLLKSQYERNKMEAYYASFQDSWKEILTQKVSFYKNLSEENKTVYQNKIGLFLAKANISGIGVEIDDTLRLLIASSAIIPVFHLEGWDYINMGEILVYNGEVTTGHEEDKNKNSILLGQVRPFQTKHMVLLSKKSLEAGFQNMEDGQNVGIHEFAHMIDQADGDIDGVPKILMPKELLQPWTKMMFEEIQRMTKRKSDLNPYGLTNHAEFFAVVCEYFFENPTRFQKKHPEMFEILERVFRTDKVHL